MCLTMKRLFRCAESGDETHPKHRKQLQSQTKGMKMSLIALQRNRLAAPTEEFLVSRGDEALQLQDAEWIIDLAFLMDVAGKQKHLNYELKGEGEAVCDTTRAAEAFNVRITIFLELLMRRNWPRAVRANEDASGALEKTLERSSKALIEWCEGRVAGFDQPQDMSAFCLALLNFQELSCDQIILELHRLRETKCLTLR